MKLSERVSKLTPYLFAEIDRQKAQVLGRGDKLMDLSIGDPDLPPPRTLVDELKSALNDQQVHRYPSYRGSVDFRAAAARWFNRRYGVGLDPGNEIIALIGSKEGLAHLTMAHINTGDVALVPSPGYPVYSQATILAGGVPHMLPLSKENGFLPDLDKIPARVLKKTKLLFLNYPNNPTSACATRQFFEKAVALAREHKFIICHDAAYIEIYSGSQAPISILSIPGAKEVAVEFHSFSKTYCIAGWRIGFAAGNAKVINNLALVKENVDSGVFLAVQRAVIYAMEHLDGHIEGIRSIYASRRQTLAKDLERMGFHVWPSNASFYLWTKYPQRMKSIDFCKRLLDQAAIAATPGVGFGPEGEGFVRFSLTIATEYLDEVTTRMAKL